MAVATHNLLMPGSHSHPQNSIGSSRRLKAALAQRVRDEDIAGPVRMNRQPRGLVILTPAASELRLEEPAANLDTDAPPVIPVLFGVRY